MAFVCKQQFTVITFISPFTFVVTFCGKVYAEKFNFGAIKDFILTLGLRLCAHINIAESYGNLFLFTIPLLNEKFSNQIYNFLSSLKLHAFAIRAANSSNLVLIARTLQ